MQAFSSINNSKHKWFLCEAAALHNSKRFDAYKAQDMSTRLLSHSQNTHIRMAKINVSESNPFSILSIYI